jgi:hypothetical protein
VKQELTFTHVRPVIRVFKCYAYYNEWSKKYTYIELFRAEYVWGYDDMSSKTYFYHDMLYKFWFSSKIVSRMWRNIPVIVHRNTTASNSRTLCMIWIYWLAVIIPVLAHRAISRWYVCSFSSYGIVLIIVLVCYICIVVSFYNDYI